MTYQVRRDYRQIPSSLSVPFVASATSVFHYVDTTSVTIATNPQTFASLDFGVAASNRRIIVGIAIGTPGSLDAVTIGGVTGTQLLTISDKVVSTLELWIANVPSGTTGSIVINDAALVGIEVLVSWWVAYTTSDTPSFLDFGSGAGTNPVAVVANVTIPANGFAVSIPYLHGDAAGIHSINQSFLEQEEVVSLNSVIAPSQREVVGALGATTVTSTWTSGAGSGVYTIIASWANA